MTIFVDRVYILFATISFFGKKCILYVLLYISLNAIFMKAWLRPKTHFGKSTSQFIRHTCYFRTWKGFNDILDVYRYVIFFSFWNERQWMFFLVSNSTKTPRKGFYVQLPRFDVVALRVRLHPIEFHSIWKWRAGEICFSTETTFPHITFTFQLRSKLDIQQFHVLETVRRIPFEHFFAPFFFQWVCSSIQFVICHFRTKRSLNLFVSSLVYFSTDS